LSNIKNIPQILNTKTVRNKYANIPKPYLDVAEGMEAQFTNHLLNQMRKTVPSVKPETQAEKIYKSMLDNERSKTMATSQTGIGIKDLVLDQIYPKHKRVSPREMVKMYNPNLNSQKGENHE
jgi:Rod binding domain-containing protein